MKLKLILALIFTLTLATAPVFAQTNPACSTTTTAALSSDALVVSLTAVSCTISIAGETARTRALAAGDGLYINGEYMTVAPSYSSGLQVPVVRGQLGTVGKAHPSGETTIYGPPTMFSTANPGAMGSTCPSAPAPWLIQVNTVTGNVWLCRQLSATRRVWTATNDLLLTYNSLTVR